MARARTPAKILELRGAFAHNPDRTREDMAGSGPFNPEPPAELNGREIACWRWLVERAPLVALYSRDEAAMRQAARLKACLDEMHPTSADFKKLDDAYRQWLMQLCMTLQSSTKVATSGSKDKGNRFEKFKPGTDAAG